MSKKIKDLVDLITTEHPEILTYYELTNYDRTLTIEGLARAYGMQERYGKIDFRKATKITYLSIKAMATKKETKERLEREFIEVSSKRQQAKKPSTQSQKQL